jgi:antiviral helicase SKI2
LKEMVEILFSRNLIKILFATETFAMGVNMPARAVVFNSIRKHDGTQFRVLEPGEYTQMAGRAGRRGLDKVGTVIMCCFGDEPPPIPLLRNMLTGSSTMLRSQFRLTYNMILNLLRVEEMSVESMIKRSFSEFATQRALAANEYPKLLAKGKKTLSKLEDQFKLEASQRVGADDLEDYFSTCSRLLSANRAILSFISESVGESGDAALQQGRIILVSAARKYGLVHAPAIILQVLSSPGASDASVTQNSLVCMVLLPESYVHHDEPGTRGGEARPAGTIGHIGRSNRRHFAIYELPLDNVLVVSATKRKIEAGLLFKKDAEKNALPGFPAHSAASFFPSKPTAGALDNPFAGMKARGKSKLDDDHPGKGKRGVNVESESIEKAMEALLEAEKEEAGGGIPVMDLRDCVKRGSEVVEFRRHCTVVLELAAQMRQYSSHRHPAIGKYFSILDRQRTLKVRVDALQHLLSNESLSLFPDFLQRKAVLRSLGYLDQSETVCVKGRVACEVSTCEELIVTEMVFEGILNDLEPTEIVAALSALVYQQKSDDSEFDMEIPETLLVCCQRMKAVATNLGQLQKEHGLEIDPADYCEASLKFGLVHVVYEWALGVPFRDICDLTTAQEGSIVRCITRLDELCREVRNCARVVGNPTLYRKMEAASVAIKRDIVFASSLYVS